MGKFHEKTSGAHVSFRTFWKSFDLFGTVVPWELFNRAVQISSGVDTSIHIGVASCTIQVGIDFGASTSISIGGEASVHVRFGIRSRFANNVCVGLIVNLGVGVQICITVCIGGGTRLGRGICLGICITADVRVEIAVPVRIGGLVRLDRSIDFRILILVEVVFVRLAIA
ncbi:hypothetical protein-transmembrane prediction [Rhodopirellula baltica SH 1]|uniref:Uncharacterized protein n=1 Tax=Rhodopirellula baltica (strain DSM 10527 / NCIMB 13988 / SH1) TaxID=243090 RepID=Q7USW9_RHOBA|nr:hypothetical protein-transmembrane prediction [Rhodopirellula baltica SH 1]